MNDGICRLCGKPFEKRNPNHKYCCKDCAFLAKSKYTRRCIECGKYYFDFDSSSGGLCSIRCRDKKQVFNHYGRACACCGESIPEMLTIDHIAEDGAEHRKKIGTSLYIWLARQYQHNGQWPAGFQVLCRNCNYAKTRNHGLCCLHEMKDGFVRFDMKGWGDEGPVYEGWDP